MPPPRIRDADIVFTLDDPARELAGVRLVQELVRPRLGPPLRRRGTRWTVAFPRLAVDRMEYQLALQRPDGSSEFVCDPANPLRSAGPFGDKSVVELPAYRPPGWLLVDSPAGTLERLDIRRSLETLVWTSDGADPDAELPLLVVHDGPEVARFALLPRYLASLVAEGRLPPHRAALLQPPGDRNQSYSASGVYLRTLMQELLPALPLPAERRLVVGMGASLGALAAFHAHRRRPDIFGGLFLQSGSFFRSDDEYERNFVRFGRITRFVEAVHAGRLPGSPVPVVLTCGSVEENLGGNRALRDTLARERYPVELHEVRDAHNWVAWRDGFEPQLGGLLARLWT